MNVENSSIETYLQNYEDSVVIGQSNNVIELELKNGEKKYLLYYEFRLFCDKTLVSCSIDKKFINNNLIELIKFKKIKKTTINDNGDLVILFHDWCVLECLNISIVYDNWELNYELICGPSGEISYFYKTIVL